MTYVIFVSKIPNQPKQNNQELHEKHLFICNLPVNLCHVKVKGLAKMFNSLLYNSYMLSLLQR